MTSELISNLISSQKDSPSLQPSEHNIEKNQSIFSPKPNLNINAEKFIPKKEIIKNDALPEIQPNSTENNSSQISPSFSHYLNPQILLPYDNMLKKNIRTFNLLQNLEKKEEAKLENSLKEKYNLDTPTIEINFKFTCDYESIESEIKEFLELFGEINSLDYDVNANSAKINYKYYFSAMYANNYLNHLLNENKNKNEIKNENENIIINNENNINKNENYENEKNPKISEEKQNEDIVKFIKFLTDNYKNEPKIKISENERKSSGEKSIKQIALSEDNKINDKNNDNTNNNMNYFSLKKNNNSAKNLFLQQNSETPIKKTNTITTYSANNRNPNTNTNNTNNNSENKTPKFNTFASSTHITPSLRTPLLYVPFVPQMNMGIPISIPVLFPINSPFLNKSFYQNNNVNITNENNKNDSKKETKINSCLIDKPSNNPINALKNEVKNDIINSQTQNDNHIKEIFDNLNNKIAIISNNSNNSTNSNEKNMKNAEINNGSEQKSNSEIGSNNNILSNKSDSTIKTEEVNKSNNTKSDNSSDKDINNNININNEVLSSFNGKTLSLEKLNNFLQDNKPITNFANPKLSLSSQKNESLSNPEKNDSSNSKQNDFSKDINKQNNNNINNTSNNNPKISNFDNNNINNNQKNRKALFPLPLNNIFNSMFNFLLLPNLQNIPNKKIPQIPPKINLPLPNPNIFKLKPNPINFNKNVIDFNKLTLETKNKVHFTTHSSRNYYYKYVCNYVVQIENDNLFMVTKRIIGKNGCFLKKILQESCIKYGDFSTKIRLRGKGSGYIDKVNKSEDDEPLILSVSSLNYPTYFNCCLLVDNLMNKIYDDYYLHLKNILPKELHYSIHKKKLIKNEFIVDRVNTMTSYCENKNNSVNNNNLNLTEDKKEEKNTCDDNNKDRNENENVNNI